MSGSVGTALPHTRPRTHTLDWYGLHPRGFSPPDTCLRGRRSVGLTKPSSPPDYGEGVESDSYKVLKGLRWFQDKTDGSQVVPPAGTGSRIRFRDDPRSPTGTPYVPSRRGRDSRRTSSVLGRGLSPRRRGEVCGFRVGSSWRVVGGVTVSVRPKTLS